MKKMHFQNTDEFERVFKNTDIEITEAMVNGIQEAFSFQKKTADLFEISFEDVDIIYEISLPSTQWEIALESCLDQFHNYEMSDQAIDTYLLQKDIRKWLS